MLLKRMNIITILICFLFMFSSYGITKVNASTVNPQTDINCSKYLNIMYDDNFMSSVTVSTLKLNPKYIIGNKYAAEYIEKNVSAPEKMQKDNIGFKCNGIFYSDYIEINESGKYVFKVFKYKMVKGVKTCTGSLLETVSITVNIDDSLKMNANTFYYEHYGDSETLINKIRKSFNYEISLSEYSISKIKSLYNQFLSKLNSSNGGEDISSFVNNYNMSLEVYFKGIKLNYNINLLSASNKELKSKFVDNVSEITKNVPKLAFDVLINKGLSNKYPQDVLSNQLDISNYLNYSEGQNIEVSLDASTSKIPSLTSSTQSYKLITISYSIKDWTLNKEYKYIRHIAFYNSNFIKDNQYDLKIIYNDKYICDKNEEFKLNDYVKDVYYEITLDNVVYRDYYDIKSYNLSETIDTSTLGDKNVNISVLDTKGKNSVISSMIKISDNKPPIILTQYDLIIVEKGSVSYIKQIKVIDNNSVNEKATTYDINETSENGGYITITAYDIEGFETIKTIPFIYKTEPNFYQKTLGRLLYNWGNFLREIF